MTPFLDHTDLKIGRKKVQFADRCGLIDYLHMSPHTKDMTSVSEGVGGTRPSEARGMCSTVLYIGRNLQTEGESVRNRCIQSEFLLSIKCRAEGKSLFDIIFADLNNHCHHVPV